MRSKIRCLLVMLLLEGILIHPAFAASVFPDVDASSKYAEAVACVSEAGIMVGDEKGHFNPNKTVTRAEMATIICRLSGETSTLQKSSDFSDVPANHWANAYISKAVGLGIVNGYGNRKFGPSDNVTYEQAVTMVVRGIGNSEEANSLGGYPDGFLALANELGLLEGISVQKGNAISRADIAVLLYNYYIPSFLRGES